MISALQGFKGNFSDFDALLIAERIEIVFSTFF